MTGGQWNQLTAEWQELLLCNLAFARASNKGAYNFWKTPAENFSSLHPDKVLPGIQAYSTEEVEGLGKIDIYGTAVTDLKPLKAINNLKEFYCGSTAINDLTALRSQHFLQKLCLYNTPVADLSPLAGILTLERLCVAKSNVGDIRPMANLKNLEKLSLYRTKITDITPLQNLLNLKKLNINHTRVNDLSPLYNLRSLQELHCCNTAVDTEGIAAFKQHVPGCSVIQNQEIPETEYDDFE